MAMIAAAVVILIPFHAFLTVWLADGFGGYTALRLWKEYLLALLFAGGLYLLWVDRSENDAVRKNPLFLLILAYGALLLVSGAVAVARETVSPLAYAYGLLQNGRFLVFFVAVWLAVRYGGNTLSRWKHFVLWPAAVVVIFALLQYFVFPINLLERFGYGPETIPAVSTIDDKEAYQRVQSTLRGANPLGAYLVVIISVLAVSVASRWRRTSRWHVALLALSFVALALTFSRSAWIGVLAALGCIIWLAVQKNFSKRLIAGVLAGFVIAFGTSVYLLRDNDTFQNAFFHTDENSQSEISSNTGRFNALSQGVRDIANEPLGRGTGTAGPASFYNTGKQPRIAENYYMQIGQEVGWLGIGLFVAINVYVGKLLWRARQNDLAMALLASLIGLTLVNMLSHAWADDTLAYLWWGLAGIMAAYPVADHKRQTRKAEAVD